MPRTITLLTAAFAMLIASAAAQDQNDQVTLQVSRSDQYGDYLTDAQGRTVYLFLSEEREGQGPERMTDGVREAAVSCTGECLDAWPAFSSEGEV